MTIRRSKEELLAALEALKEEREKAESARKRAEKAAQESEELLRAVLNYAPTPIHVTSPDGRFRLVNRAWEDAFGLKKEEVLGRLRSEVLPPDAAQYFNSITEQVLQTGKTTTLEERSDLDPESRYYLGITFPLRDSEGEIDAIGGISADITELQRVQKALHQSENHYRTLLDNLPDIITRISRDLIYLYVSPGIEAWVGVPGSDFIGKHVTAVGGDKVRLGHWETLVKEVFRTGRPQERDFSQETPGGTRYIHIRLVPEWEEEEVSSVLTIARDMTDLRQAEQERLDFERRILETQKLESLGILAGGIAHDFNNLLMAILGNAELALADMPSDDGGRDAVLRIETVARRAAELTRQMLAYSGRGKFVVEQIDLNSLVQDMTDLMQVSLGKNVRLQGEYAPGLPPIEGDASQIRQVVMNLLVNASDAIGAAAGTVTLRTGVIDADQELLRQLSSDPDLPAGTYVFLEVSDTGCGIDPEILKKIFDPFFTTKFTGRGLGLAAVQGIVRGHHGAIEVESRKNSGTRFRLLLPACKSSSERIISAATQNPTWRGAGLALVVDDEETIRSVTSLLLEKIGFTALKAADGQEALELFRTHGKEIVCTLLDLTMPEMNGRETFLAIRRLSPNARVILMSGYAEQDAAARFGEEGLAGFLQKPFHSSDLREILKQAMTPAS